MQSKIIIFLIQYIIFCCEYNVIKTKTLVGYHVQTAVEEELPTVACINVINNQNVPPVSKLLCSGTLISFQHVLTAEHCFDNLMNSYFEIILGSIYLSNSNKHYPMWWQAFDNWATVNKHTINYPKNDIAVIKLVQLVSSRNIPAILSNIPNQRWFQSNAVMLGWGRINNSSFPTVLHKASLKVLSNDECSRVIHGIIGRRIFIHEPFLCTNTFPYVQLEEGDSGGPLLHQNTIIGVNYGRCPSINEFNPRLVNVHTSVSFYKTFLDSALVQ